MKQRSAHPCYEIRVRGSLSERLLAAFPPDLTHEVRDGTTVLVGPLPDQAALYGALDQLESLGIELLGVSAHSCESSGSDDDRSSRRRGG
jgi:hypothetical protein